MHLWFECGANRQSAAVKLVLAIKRCELAAHFLGEILGRIELAAGLAWDDVERLLLGRIALYGGDVAILSHAIEHVIAALDGRLRVLERVVVVRPLGQAGEVRRLRQIELIQRLVEIVQRRGGDPVRVQPEEDFIEIELEDLVLGEGRVDPDGKDRLFDLAVEGLFRTQQKVLGHLLGNRRGADQRPAAAIDMLQDIVAEGADDAIERNAVMVVEVLVLSRNERVEHDRRHGFDRLEQPPLMRIFGKQRAVRRVHTGGHRRLIVLEHRIVG